MSRRRQLAHLLHATGALGAILKVRARTSPPWLSILTYHRFATNDGSEPFDDGVVDVTRTHQTLPPDALAEELQGSRDDLERELGEPVRALAYPVGNPIKSTSPIRAALMKAGYEIGFTNGTGPTPLWGRVDPFNIRRQTMERDFADPYFLGILAIPFLAPIHPWHLRADCSKTAWEWRSSSRLARVARSFELRRGSPLAALALELVAACSGAR